MKRNPIFKIIRTYFTKQQLFYSLFFALIVITISSCKDECDKVNTRYEITPELKAFYFKKGTYWVYEDTVNHVVDSQFVCADTCGFDYTTTKGDKGAYCQLLVEFFRSIITSQLSSGNIDSLYFGSHGSYYISNEVLSIGYPYQGGNVILWPNADVGKTFNSYRFNGIANQNVNGVDYKNTYWSSVILGATTNNYLKYNTDYFVTPKIGVVKKVEFGTPTGTRTWLLKRYFIQS